MSSLMYIKTHICPICGDTITGNLGILVKHLIEHMDDSELRQLFSGKGDERV